MNLFDTRNSTCGTKKWRFFRERKLTKCSAARCLTGTSSDYLLEILFFLVQVKTVNGILIHIPLSIVSTLLHEISDDKLMVGVSCNVFWLFNSVSSGYRRRVIFRIPKSQTFLGMDERFVIIRKEHSETNHFEWVRWCIIPFCAKRLSEICSSYLWKYLKQLWQNRNTVICREKNTLRTWYIELFYTNQNYIWILSCCVRCEELNSYLLYCAMVSDSIIVVVDDDL